MLKEEERTKRLRVREIFGKEKVRGVKEENLEWEFTGMKKENKRVQYMSKRGQH